MRLITEKESLETYRDKFQIRPLYNWQFGHHPDSYFVMYNKGDYGLYVPGKGWFACDPTHNMPASYRKKDLQGIKAQLCDPNKKLSNGYFVTSINEPVTCAIYNIMKVGYLQLLNPIKVTLCSYAWPTHEAIASEFVIDSVEFEPRMREPMALYSNNVKLYLVEINRTSKLLLSQEIERTLLHYSYNYEYCGAHQANVAFKKEYEKLYLRN